MISTLVAKFLPGELGHSWWTASRYLSSRRWRHVTLTPDWCTLSHVTELFVSLRALVKVPRLKLLMGNTDSAGVTSQWILMKLTPSTERTGSEYSAFYLVVLGIRTTCG